MIDDKTKPKKPKPKAKKKKKKVPAAPKPFVNTKKVAGPGQKACAYPLCGGLVYQRGICRYHYKVDVEEGGNTREKALKIEQESKEAKEKRRLDTLNSLSNDDLRKMFLTPCKTRAELMNFVKFFFGLHLPDVNVSRFTDTNPFDALWELYQLTVLEKDLGVKELIYCASRGSGKTLAVAIAQLLAVVHGKRDVVHVGAIMSQAQRCYEYVQGFLLGDKVRPIVVPENAPDSQKILLKDNMTKSLLKIGGRNCTVEILPCTLRAVNGPHVSFVTVDEVDTLATGEAMRAYKDISGMLDSRDGRRAIRVNISTRKSRYGLMNELMENADKQGKTVRRWTVFEFMSRCPDSRSGIMKQNYFIDQMKADVKTPEEFAKVPDNQKKEYIEHDMFIGCQKCPLAFMCFVPGTLITMANGTLKKIEDISADDLVISHTGQTRRVYGVMNRVYTGDLVSIERYGWSMPSLVTPEHPYFIDGKWKEAGDISGGYVATSYSVINGSPIESSNGRGTRVSADNLFFPKIKMSNTHMIDIVSYLPGKYSIESESIEMVSLLQLESRSRNRARVNSKIRRFINLDNDFGWLVGLYAAEGSSMKAKTRQPGITGSSNIVFSLHEKETHLIDRITSILNKIAPDSILNTYTTDSSKGVMITVSNNILSKLLLKITGEYCDKKIIEQTLFNSNLDFVRGFLAGFWNGDGNHGDSYDFNDSQPKSLATTSHALASQIYSMLNTIGLAASMSGPTQHPQRKPFWIINWSNSNSKLQAYKSADENGSYFRVKKSSRVPYEGRVYNFSVEVDESYIANGVAVHNCLGDAKKQTSRSPMLKTIDEVAQKVLGEGPDWALSQLMNLKPSVEGIIYKEFDERQHIKTWSQMWEILTSTVYPGTCDHDTFVKKCHAMGLQAYAGIDWGWSNPSTVVILFVDKRENIYVVKCDGQTYVSNPTWIHHIKTKYHNKYRISLYFPDNADPGNLQEMQKAGLPASDKAGKSKVETGVQVVKKWLRAPGSASPKIFLATETCASLIKEFQTYHFKTSADGTISDDIDTESDHWLDSLRYTIEGIFGKSQILLSSESMESYDTTSIVNSRGEYLRPPSPQEWAQVNNITLNPTADQDKIGKIGRLSDLEGATDDEDGFSSGFLWSF